MGLTKCKTHSVPLHKCDQDRRLEKGGYNIWDLA